MEQFIKGMRVDLDSLVKALDNDRCDSAEITLGKRNLQNGTMWLGLTLGAIGADYPYKESTNKESQVIEDRTDQAETVFTIPQGRIAGVKDIRRFLQVGIDAIESERNSSPAVIGAEVARRLTKATDYLRDSKNWFGMELERIHLAKKAHESYLESMNQRAIDEGKQAYIRFVANSSVDGVMPSFEDLTDEERNAWKMVMEPYVNNQGISVCGRQDMWGV